MTPPTIADGQTVNGADRDVARQARRARALDQLVGIGIAVMAEPDVSVVLDRIVLEARRFVKAEAATLFIRDGQELRVSVFQNDGLAGRLVERTLRTRRQDPAIALEALDLPAFAARSGGILNVPDVYALASGAACRFDPTWDRMNEHRTRSMFLIPLVDRAGYLLGVLELSNALDDTGAVTVFDPDPASEQVVRAFAAQAAIAIENSRLTELSFVDALTGAYNRRYFLLRLEQESKRHSRFEQPYAVVLFDVDNLKPVNDRFGHSAGDGMLTTLSRLLSAQSRGFTVIARLGGDEFGAVLPQTPKTGALQYAERIRRLIEAYPFRHSPVTVSVGVAAVPDDLDGKAATTPEALIQAADRALYEAKRSGRNRVASLPPTSAVTP
jgi:diguanylate cyclase (GGDEF)-like protein